MLLLEAESLSLSNEQHLDGFETWVHPRGTREKNFVLFYLDVMPGDHSFAAL